MPWNWPDDPCTKHALRVASGEVIAGPHVRDACTRHLKDLVSGHERGLTWHVDRVDDVIQFFEQELTVEVEERDEFGDVVSVPKAFVVHESQAFILGSLFGWYRNGIRRFRRCYIEIGKGNGKSPLAAGIGHYMLIAMGKLRAEVYSAATDKDQASILFRDAVEMYRRSAALSRNLVTSGHNPVWQLTFPRTSSYFKPISSEKKGKSGIRPFCALIDEVHEHPNNDVIEMMRAGTKGNQSALIFEITNSGNSRESVCWDEHEYSIKIASGEEENDGWFSYVSALDSQPRDVVYDTFQSLCRVVREPWPNVRITLGGKSTHEVFASPATAASDDPSPKSDVVTIQIEELLRKACASTATSETGKSGTGRKPKSDEPTSESTRKAISKESRPESEIEGTGSASGQKTPTSTETSAESQSSASLQMSLPSWSDYMAEYVASAERNPTMADLFGWITATIRALSEGSSATSATLGSVCSEILQSLWSELSSTSVIPQRLTWKKQCLVESFEPDDPFEDESCWIKANPLLGVSIFPDFIREQVEEAKGMPSKEALVRRLHFCQWTEGAEGWITRDVWMKTEAELDLADYEGEECYGGLDLSYTKDLSAFALVFPVGGTQEEPELDGFCWFWKPTEGLQEAIRDDRVPYDVWAKEGHLLLTQGRVIKLEPIAQHMAELSDRFNIRSIAYDNYRHRELEDDMIDLGIELPMVEHPQGFRRTEATRLWMPNSVQDLENGIIETRFRFKVNPLLRYNVAQAVIREDPAGTDNRIFDKKKSRARIDGIVAMAMAVGAAVVREEPVFGTSLASLMVDMED